ncbi:hypothetical protein COX85_03110 [Candidatus Micrarchaeota archaeon CG_4_10_14_0_2_um_filter_55_9]|nr:MAG: hypothetical protein AUJ15_02455 [Candidatus Micrarchaeota archaeon CG1_02_55_41]PIO03858.1 MAG: hypothetical protein COT57_00270 [Candidatus Micrarchaeota archaeon CG09_land_8_20_14_0_10_55_25]PIZ91580.1 MAG: hypothetical protein COX85_03110 [Candidatus Micrarchaeota archaeon CG_4_10_14_0_2_um_filter_55_9]PJD00991.1 MAG: hypothetical protein COU38_03380 [Candidatus Micrarchaeota archaeon CG10_big_fil_rev_8_21_14_0_10_54_18]
MVVVSLGGSLLFDESGKRNDYAERVAPILRGHAIVVGGGRLAAKYVGEAHARGENFFWCDREGIRATYENAEHLASKISGVVCRSIDECLAAMERGENPVMGGLLEGVTTDADAVLLAEALGEGRLVNASRVEALYDRHPNEEGAKRLERLTHDELVDLAFKSDKRESRTNFPFDVFASMIARRAKISIDFVDGRDSEQLKAALNGKKHNGTVVTNK